MNRQKPLRILLVGNGPAAIGLLLEDTLLDEMIVTDILIEQFPEKAMQILTESRCSFDLLITGGRIQGVGDAGLELTIFARNLCPELKIIMMSSWCSQDEALSAGADRHWFGSSNIEELIEIIHELFKE